MLLPEWEKETRSFLNWLGTAGGFRPMKSAKACDSQGGWAPHGEAGRDRSTRLCADFGGGRLGAPEACKNHSPTPNPLQFLSPAYIWLQKSVLVSPGRSDPGPSASNKAFTPPTPAIHFLLDSFPKLPSLFQVLMKVQPNSG